MSEPWWARPGGAPAQGQPWQQPESPTAAPAPRRGWSKRRKTLLWGGVAIVVVEVAVLIGVLWGTGSINGTTLTVASAEAGVAEILSDPINGYGANDVTGVVCNDGVNPAIETGAGFSCDVEINGQQRTVEVVFSDDEGNFAVDGPR